MCKKEMGAVVFLIFEWGGGGGGGWGGGGGGGGGGGVDTLMHTM